MGLPTNPTASVLRLNPELFGRRVAPVAAAERPDDEAELHDQIESYCNARGWLICHSRMDKPSTIAVGFPDFTIHMHGARTVFLECKAPGKKATVEQLRKLAHARKLGFIAEIVENMDSALAAIAAAQA